MSDVGATLEELEQYLSERQLRGSGLPGARERRPAAPSRTGPAGGHWKWADIHAGLLQSGSLVTLGPSGMTEMRTVSPQAGPQCPISLGAQILMPGERTRAHRNMKNETRLVWEAPAGAFFVCEYEAFPMQRGDVVVSPTWTYHDHWNDGDAPAIWIEGFDNGYATLGEAGPALNQRFPADAPYQAIRKREDFALKTLGHVRQRSGEPVYPLPPMRYPWGDTQAALKALQESEVDGDPFDGLHLTFTSPVDGGPTLPTIAWHIQLLNVRQKTLAHRHNSSTYYCVFEGEGVTTIEDERIEWGPGDLFLVPPWKWHSHQSTGSADAILFSIDDWPAMTKLGFYKKEEEAK